MWHLAIQMKICCPFINFTQQKSCNKYHALCTTLGQQSVAYQEKMIPRKNSEVLSPDRKALSSEKLPTSNKISYSTDPSEMRKTLQLEIFLLSEGSSSICTQQHATHHNSVSSASRKGLEGNAFRRVTFKSNYFKFFWHIGICEICPVSQTYFPVSHISVRQCHVSPKVGFDCLNYKNNAELHVKWQ